MRKPRQRATPAESGSSKHRGGALAAAPRWSLSDRGLDVGPTVEGGRFEFAGVVAAHVLSGDTIVVVDRMSRQLRYFSPEGEHVRSVGRQGNGPGEFGTLLSAPLLDGDTIAVWDLLNRRITLVDASGLLVREVPIGSDAFERGFTLVERLDGGDWAAWTRDLWYLGPEAGTLPEDVIHDSVSYVRVTPDGGSAQTVLKLPHLVQDVRPRERGATTMRIPFPKLFSPRVHVAGGGRRIVTGRSDRFELSVWDDSGLVQVIRASPPGRPVTGAHVEALVEARRAELSGRPAVEFERELSAVRETPPMEQFPAFDRVVIGRDTATWVRRSVAPGDSMAAWVVFSADGAVAGAVETPATSELLEAGRDYVLLLLRDDLDVESVARRSLQRS